MRARGRRQRFNRYFSIVNWLTMGLRFRRHRGDNQKASLAVVFLTVVIDLLGFGMVLPLLPVYARELMADFSPVERQITLGLLMTCYSILQLVFEPLWSRISDYLGRRPILVFSLAGSTICYTVFGLAVASRSLTWMFVARIVGGVVGATIPTAQAYIADVTPLERRARGMAIIGAAFGLGFTFGPLLGAVALLSASPTELSPWPGFLAGGLSAIALVVAATRLEESLGRRGSIRQVRQHVNLGELRRALAVPSIGLLLITLFLCNFGFAAFEGTLSLVLASFLDIDRGGYQILLAFSYVGFVQALVQGLLVRWLATFTDEAVLSAVGAAVAILGYMLLGVGASPETGGPMLLMLAASIVVSGLGFIYPSVNALISRRSDPTKQGGILGIGGSLSSLARISGIQSALLLAVAGQATPFWFSAGLMMAALMLVVVAARSGRDFSPSASAA